MTDTHLVVERHDGYAVVTLNRPDRLNALTHALVEDLRTTLAELDGDDSVRSIVLTGAGRAFCAGADLGGGPSDAEDVVRRLYSPLVTQLLTQRTPVVGAINGVAAGAGFSIALATDLRVASDDARLTLAFVRIGLVPDAAATWLLPRLVGQTRAAEIALLGRPVDAPTALAWSLVNEVTTKEAVVARACEIAAELAALPASVGPIKELMHGSWSRDLAAQIDAEATAQGTCSKHPHYAEARAAFAEKRSPTFW